MSSGLARCALAAALFACASANSTWYFVDVSEIVCGSQGEVQIEIPLDAIPAGERGDPHILTFFRTSTEAISIQYNLTDSSSPEAKALHAENVTLRSLNASAARRLQGRAEVAELEEQGLGELDADFESTLGEEAQEAPEEEDEEEEEVESGDDSGARRLFGGSRRRSPGSFGGSPRRRSGTGAGPAATPAGGAGASGVHRRRSAPAAGAAAHPSAPAAPASGWGNGHQAGSYRYPSQAALSQNYGGHQPLSTGYGYSGAGAVRGNSGAQVAMAMGAGVLAGAGAGYAWSHLHNLMGSSGHACWAGDQQYRSCEECRSKHSPASDCAGRFTPKVDLARDDLMNSGFVPSNVTGPLRLIITEVLGVDFTPEKLCIAGNLTDNVTGNVSGNLSSGSVSAIFVTLTRLATVPAVDDALGESAEASGRSPFHFLLMAGFAACCCAGCVACGMIFKRSGDDEFDKFGPQPVQYPPVQYPAAQYPAQFAGAQQAYPVGFQPGYPQMQYPGAPYTPGQPVAVQMPPQHHLV